MLSLNKIANYAVTLPHYLWHDAFHHAKHDYRNVFLKTKRDISRLLNESLAEASILVLGCGYAYSDVILFSQIAPNVVGLDTINAFYRDGITATYRDLRRANGFLKGLINTIRLQTNTHRYYKCLRKFGAIISHNTYELSSYDGCWMPFEDDTFDVVLSNAVLEHVTDLTTLFREVYRVTKPNGISRHHWHNYYSFSGGHVPPMLCKRHPWGHLRRKYTAPHDLNKVKPREVVQCLGEYFHDIRLYQVDREHNKKGIDDNFRYEHEDLLSPTLRRELREYPVELLLTRSYQIIAHKP